MENHKLKPGTTLPDVKVKNIKGGELSLKTKNTWKIIVVYRGLHCPKCKSYLNTLNELEQEYRNLGFEILALSTDPEEKAVKQAKDQELKFDVGYDLSLEDANKLGLYISNPRSEQETDRPFSEPGLYILNPKNEIQVLDISNSPFSRPDLKELLGGMKFTIENNYPIRGTHDN
jgi:peroxiredoxin